VLTGTPIQGMVITVPIGVLCFLPIALLTGDLTHLAAFPVVAAASMAGAGVLYFLFGRYCFFRANHSAGANLSAPVIQMQVVVTLALAVIVLMEPCTLLQMLGGVVMLGGSLLTQSQRASRRRARVSVAEASAAPTFVPRFAEGMLFSLLTAVAYGTTPIIVRLALRQTGPSSAVVGGLIAYASATVAIAVLLGFSTPLRRNVMALRRESLPWFVYSGVMLALAQGFLYSAVAIAPILLVVPLQQSSVVFRLIFSSLLNPAHEVFGLRVIIGAILSIVGACTVSIDSSLILNAVGAPDDLARLLRWRV
jgi:drug/metabolite transporter (DMT)-like permease